MIINNSASLDMSISFNDLMDMEASSIKNLKINVENLIRTLHLVLNESKVCRFSLTKIPSKDFFSQAEMKFTWDSGFFQVCIYDQDKLCVEGDIWNRNNETTAFLSKICASPCISGTTFMTIWEKICSQVNPKDQNLCDAAKILCKFSSCEGGFYSELHLRIWRIFIYATENKFGEEFSGSWYENFNYKIKLPNKHKESYYKSVHFLMTVKLDVLKTTEVYDSCLELMKNESNEKDDSIFLFQVIQKLDFLSKNDKFDLNTHDVFHKMIELLWNDRTVCSYDTGIELHNQTLEEFRKCLTCLHDFAEMEKVNYL